MSAPQFYIPATSSLAERRPRTLKHGDTFAVFDHYGDFAGGARNPEGLYHRDTRHLSTLRLQIEEERPLLLSSTVQNNNAMLSADLTNPDVFRDGTLVLPRDSIHVLRSKFLWQSGCHELIAVRNYSDVRRVVRLSVEFAADFADIFEVRGQRRPERGSLAVETAPPDRVWLRYTGLDRVVRETRLTFDPHPESLAASRAQWRVALEPGERRALFVVVSCGTAAPLDCRFFVNLRQARRARVQASKRMATVETSNEIFNELLCRSAADLAMLTTDTEHGPYPYAGTPWFSTAFGRDGLITALQMLWVDPLLARGVLRFLAATQAQATDPAADAEPGKILHESRHGEMARLREVPFGMYYGSVDATPLFVMLAGLYWERTGDLDTIRQLWPNILAALGWIDGHGDRDRDGFVEYLRQSRDGLDHQGWKDSRDAVFHADGSSARGPIALCEVQAYVYEAKRLAARLAQQLEGPERAARLRAEAEALRERFERGFWDDALGSYVLALDGEKRPCRVLASNAGHALLCGIAAPERASRLAEALMRPDMFSGWGIRTVSSREVRFNPTSYHNGSIWPHDNALIALGLARYGLKSEALRIFTALFEASTYMDLRRLPELFCGFRRKRDRGPTYYPVACAPQAWAAASPFALLAAALGLEFDHAAQGVRFHHPRLPDFLEQVRIRNLRLGASRFDVLLRRHGNDVAVNVLSKEGPGRVEVIL
ncbi:MAG TPA: amylo-alpha-1,6-glucosidase [Burkholderiales bacterium]|nr:amylo-alpha-1,6-glucosidase [Burkholderiales bacterium]